MKKNALSSVVFGLSLLLVSCSGGGSGVTPGAAPAPDQGLKKPTDVLGGLPKVPPPGGGDPGGGDIDVFLGDAAPRLGSLVPTEIDLGITEVDAISNGVVLPIAKYSSPVVVNVLAEQDTPGSIGVGSVVTGMYDSIRFVVDPGTSKVVANGANYPITFPLNAASAPTVASSSSTTTQALPSGGVAMTVSGSFTVDGSPANAVEADFNAFESLKVNAAGNIVARPTLYAVASTLSGKIAGTVVNSQGTGVSGATIVAFDANNRVANTDNTDATGAFKMHTLAVGTYHLVVYNTYRTNVGQTVNSANDTSPYSNLDGGYVTVTAGQITNVQAIHD